MLRKGREEEQNEQDGKEVAEGRGGGGGGGGRRGGRGAALDSLPAQAVSECSSIVFREGIEDLLRACQEAQPPVPVFIMSAGLQNVIEEILRQRLPFELAPTTVVVSNSMCFDEGGSLVGFSEPVIHMFNKTSALVPQDLLVCSQLARGASRCIERARTLAQGGGTGVEFACGRFRRRPPARPRAGGGDRWRRLTARS